MNKSIRDANILITGGAGFIGSSLARKVVKKGAKVTIIDAMIPPYGGNLFNLYGIRSKVTFIKGDIRSEKLMQKLVLGKDIIFHLAAQTGRLISLKDPKLDFDINVKGTLSILDALKTSHSKAKFIFAGSRGVIGKPRYLPVDEKHIATPRDVYGTNKLLAEKYCFQYAKNHGIFGTILRLNNVYGPRCQVRSDHYGTINLFIRYALDKKVLPVYGDGQQTRDYIYIDDTTEAFISAIDTKADGELFMIGSGKEYSLLAIVALIKKFVPTTRFSLMPYPPLLGRIDFPRFQANPKKAEQILGWQPKIPLEEGIRKTIDYYRKYLRYYV